MSNAYPAREVDLHGEDADVSGAGEVVLFGGGHRYGRDCHG